VLDLENKLEHILRLSTDLVIFVFI
jgi:hypothetical protein